MPDNDAELPTTITHDLAATDEAPAAGDTPSDQATDGSPQQQRDPTASGPTDQAGHVRCAAWCGDARPAAFRVATRPPRRSRA